MSNQWRREFHFRQLGTRLPRLLRLFLNLATFTAFLCSGFRVRKLMRKNRMHSNSNHITESKMDQKMGAKKIDDKPKKRGRVKDRFITSWLQQGGDKVYEKRDQSVRVASEQKWFECFLATPPFLPMKPPTSYGHQSRVCP